MKYGKHGILLNYDSFRNTIRQCYFTDAWVRTSPDHYSLAIYNTSSFNLIESNVFYDVTDAIISQSSSGNVIAYNYTNNVHKTQDLGSWFWSDTHTHTTHIAKCLYEGNHSQGITFDEVGGSASHNTIFRSRITGWDESGDQDTTTSNNGAIVIYSTNKYMNMIGNVLGKSGFSNYYDSTSGSQKCIYYYEGGQSDPSWTGSYRHRNYNYYTSTIKDCGDSGEPGCQSESSDTTLPNSLYLSSKPSWFGDQTWPPVDPTSPTLTSGNRIPAKVFYDTGSWPEEGGQTSFSVGSGGDYLTMTALISGEGSACAGCLYSFTANVSEPGLLNLSSYDGSSGNEITVDLNGHNWTISSGITFGDYCVVGCEGGALLAPIIPGGHNQYLRCKWKE